MKYFLILLATGLFTGCSTQPPALSRDSYGHAYTDHLIEQFVLYRDRDTAAYLDSIRAQLAFNSKSGEIPPRIRLVSSPTPISLAAPGPQVLISDTLVQRLPNEASLLFVIAHELGHIELHHAREGSGARNKVEELEADTFAVQLLQSLGYNPIAALPALHALLPVSRERDERTNALMISVRESPSRQILQRVDSRDFRRFKSLLMASSLNGS